jgi:tetratricopeptide (TPR) repeat protein
MRRTARALELVLARPPESAPPVRVVVFASEREFGRYRSGRATKGFYQSAPERDYILLVGSGEETLRAARHEYAHLVLNHTAGRLPQWLEEGLAEFYSTLEWGGGGLQVGRVIPAHIALLRRAAWIEEDAFKQPKELLAERMGEADAVVYYAQSWALTHYLMQGAGARGGVWRMVELLGEGLSQEAAFEKAFGRRLGQALREAREYVESSRFRVSAAPAGRAPQWEDPPAAKVDEGEMLAVRSDLFIAMGRVEEARRLYEEFLRRSPGDARAVAGLGLVAMREEKWEEARARLEEAIRLGSTEAATHFEYAMLLRDKGGSEELVLKNLREAVRLNPSYAEAWFLLGTMALRRNQPWEAVEALERAVEILPRQSVFWENLARALLAARQKDAARRAALRAVAEARTGQESALARAALREAEGGEQNGVRRGAAVVTPDSWSAPQAPARVEGRLVAVDCAGGAVVVEIESDGRRVRLEAAAGGVRSGDPLGAGREIRCGRQDPAPVVRAGYDPDGMKLLTLEFR